jgi:hypothetical protein
VTIADLGRIQMYAVIVCALVGCVGAILAVIDLFRGNLGEPQDSRERGDLMRDLGVRR